MIYGFSVVFLVALGLAISARSGHHERDPRSFFAARGQFGAILFFLLAVGETYSVGSVLGFPGGIVAKGPSLAVWFVGYILLAFPVGFVLYPRIWEAGRRTGAITLPELFKVHFESAWLGRFVAVLLVVLMLPLGTSQILGLNTVLKHLFPSHFGLWLELSGVALAFLFVAIAGMRAAAFVSILKDLLMFGTILAVAVGAFLAWPDGQKHALAESLGAVAPAQSLSAMGFALSTILVQAVGFCVAPQTVAAVFSASSRREIRSAQVWMPLYMLLFPLLFAIAGYALTHEVHAESPDGVFLAVAHCLLPSWLEGIVCAGVALTALVWIGAVCLALAAMVTRDVVPRLAPDHQRRAGLLVIMAYLGLSVLGAQQGSLLLSNLNTLFYLGLVQVVPGVVLIVMKRAVAAPAVLFGILLGLAIGLGLREGSIALHGINPALPGLLCNLATVALFSRDVRAAEGRA